jgi:hypothetical protein
LTPLPPLEEGIQYRVILRLPGFSIRKDILHTNILGGTFPIPTLSEKCICCNIHTSLKRDINPFEKNQVLVTPFEVPVCEKCTDHAISETGNLIVAGIILVLGISGAITFLILIFTNPEAVILMLFMLLLSVLVCFLGFKVYRKQQSKKEMKPPGHFTGASFIVRYDKELIIESSNKKVMEEILLNNSDLVFSINTTNKNAPK